MSTFRQVNIFVFVFSRFSYMIPSSFLFQKRIGEVTNQNLSVSKASNLNIAPPPSTNNDTIGGAGSRNFASSSTINRCSRDHVEQSAPRSASAASTVRCASEWGNPSKMTGSWDNAAKVTTQGKATAAGWGSLPAKPTSWGTSARAFH